MTRKPDKSNYVIWENKMVANSCVLDQLHGMDEEHKFREGVSLAETFPENAFYTMDPDFKNNTLMTDCMFNTDELIVASRAVRNFLERQGVKKVEYLPVKILNHKRKAVKEEYFIVHPVDNVDCLNVERCGATWSEMLEGQIDKVERLVLDEAKIGPERVLFRCRQFYLVTLVRRDLAEAIAREAFSGMRWVELEKYPER